MDRRKAKVFKESFHLKIVRTLISIGVFSLVVLALLGVIVLFWLPAVKTMGLTGSGRFLFLNLLKVFLLVTVILLGLVLWISFLISRNLFGPLTRLRNHMEMFIRGDDPETIKFKQSDELEFHYLSEPFNQIIDRVSNLENNVKDLERQIDDFLEKSEKGMLKKSAFIPFVKELRTKIKAFSKTA